ncbi:MAG: hypothetical protein LBJ87_09240 [bacterium]|nr:hypothetical protein [bacterium]
MSVGAMRRAQPSRRPEPLLGWRLWRARDGALESWAASWTWGPGHNHARCLAPGRRCLRPPGRGCLCGYWGLFSPLGTLERARAERTEQASVLGLIRGWGEAAVHGNEGFRAEYAGVACLFSDWVWDAPEMPCPEQGLGRAWWLAKRRFGYLPRPVPPDPARQRQLEATASLYEVPLLRLEDAVELHVLEEMGATQAMVDEVRAWLDMAGPGRLWKAD